MVYRARDTRLGREVAIKVLPGPVATDPERLRRFEQRPERLGALNHPHILTVYDVGTRQESCWARCLTCHSALTCSGC